MGSRSKARNRPAASPHPEGQDAALLRRIRAKDPEALEELYGRYASAVFSLVFRILQSRDEAEAVALDVFWQIWRQADRWDSLRGAPAAWIFTMARSRAIDRVRARHRREDRTISLDDPAVRFDPFDERASPERVASFRQTRDAVREALKTLPRPQREAIELAFFQGLTHVEIAARLRQPLGTIKTRIRQGLIRLRTRLD